MTAAGGLRIAIYGDGQWAADSLTLLAGAGHRVVGVVLRASPTDSTLGDAAARLGVPVLCPPHINAPETVAQVAALEPELGISVAYNQILRAPARQAHARGVINFHAGKLPFYRGRNVINWAIINGETEIGLTAHHVDDGIDTGDIIAQLTLPIGWTDGYGDVLRRVVERMPSFVVDTVRDIAAGTAQRRRQADHPGTYFGGRGEGDEWIDWSASSRTIHNFIRAISRPGPGARTTLGDDRIIVWRAFYDPSWPNYTATPGQVVGRHHSGALVKTGDSTILVQTIEGPSGEGPEQPKWPIGSRLGWNWRTCMHAPPVARPPR